MIPTRCETSDIEMAGHDDKSTGWLSTYPPWRRTVEVEEIAGDGERLSRLPTWQGCGPGWRHPRRGWHQGAESALEERAGVGWTCRLDGESGALRGLVPAPVRTDGAGLDRRGPTSGFGALPIPFGRLVRDACFCARLYRPRPRRSARRRICERWKIRRLTINDVGSFCIVCKGRRYSNSETVPQGSA